MTAVDHSRRASGRWSGRVANRRPEPTEGAAPGRISAPESFTPFPGAATAAERRVSRGQGERIGRSLSDRDRAVLASVQAHRFLTTAQIERFHFAAHSNSQAAARICRRVLQRLHQLRVLEHLDRRVGGVRAGSASYVWRVGLLGDRLLRLQLADQSRGRRKEPSLRHLEHCLAIADAHLMLRDLAAAGRIELLRVETEPRCWRPMDSSRTSVLKPDLCAVTASGEFEDHWFCEIDRATESLPTLLRKCTQYEQYRLTGREQQTHGVFPLVVWIVPDEARADKLRQAIAASRTLDTGLYRLCTPGSFAGLVTGGAA
jgi:Replication-relaxation